MGTSVESGTATEVIVSTGSRTYLGSMANAITEAEPQTSFDQGLTGAEHLALRQADERDLAVRFDRYPQRVTYSGGSFDSGSFWKP